MTQSRHKTLRETKERTPKDQLVKSLSQLGYLGQGLNNENGFNWNRTGYRTQNELHGKIAKGLNFYHSVDCNKVIYRS